LFEGTCQKSTYEIAQPHFNPIPETIHANPAKAKKIPNPATKFSSRIPERIPTASPTTTQMYNLVLDFFFFLAMSPKSCFYSGPKGNDYGNKFRYYFRLSKYSGYTLNPKSSIDIRAGF
jgi:hypothetical protein